MPWFAHPCHSRCLSGLEKSTHNTNLDHYFTVELQNLGGGDTVEQWQGGGHFHTKRGIG